MFALGFVVSFVFAMIAVRGLLKFIANHSYAVFAWYRIGFGLLIERAQICFTSAFRDLWITGRTYMAKAIILGMAVSAIGVFSYIQLGVAPKIMWAGPNAVIGGLLLSTVLSLLFIALAVDPFVGAPLMHFGA